MSFHDNQENREWIERNKSENRKIGHVEKAENAAREVASLAQALGSNKKAVREYHNRTGRGEREIRRDIQVANAMKVFDEDTQEDIRNGDIRASKRSLAAAPKKIRDRILRIAKEKKTTLHHAHESSQATTYTKSKTTKEKVRQFEELPNPHAVPKLVKDSIKTLGALGRKIDIAYDAVGHRDHYDSIRGAMILIEKRLLEL